MRHKKCINLRIKLLPHFAMRKKILLPFLLLCSCSLTAGELADYLNRYRQSGIADHATELAILSRHTFEQLTAELNAFYADSTSALRDKAFYLTYRKGLDGTPAQRMAAVERLSAGISGASGGTAGLLVGHLKNFAPADFGTSSRAAIVALLGSRQRPHYDELVLLAGYVGVGGDELRQLLADPSLKVRDKWNPALALARMGDAGALDYCMKKIRRAPVNGDMVAVLLPGLLYTRQREAVGYCVELLYSDEKLCYSLNPSLSENVSCAYQIMVKLAPIVVGFPIKIDASGELDTDSYPQALQQVREWFKANSSYQIRADFF
jgi:hypothetical protein